MWPNANGKVAVGHVPSFVSTYAATPVQGDTKAHMGFLLRMLSRCLEPPDVRLLFLRGASSESA